MQVAAAVAALLGALLLTWTEQRWPDVQEALIGVVFVLAATGGMLLLASNPHGGEHLRDLLVGQILWVRYDAAAVAGGAAPLLIVLRCCLFGASGSGASAFYVLFALAVTVSVQLVGVYLVFASLIIPGLAMSNYLTESACRLPMRSVSAAMRPG